MNVLIRRAVWLLPVAAIAAAVFLASRPKPVPVDVLTVAVEDVQTSVVASGRVLAPARVDIGATVTGRVQRVAVREGARVAAGELLVELERDELAAAVAQARAARDRARARVDAVSTLALPTAAQARAQAEANLALAEREHQRARELVAKGFVTQSRADDAERQLRVARSQLDAARAAEAAQTPPGAEARQAKNLLQEAEAALALAEARLAQTAIRAPAAGVVLERVIEPGDIVQPGRRMMTLALDGPARLIVDVDEKNLPLIEAGRTAVVTAEAFPAERFEAVVAYVSPGVAAARGTVELRLDVPKPPAFLRSDMTVSIDLGGPLLKQTVMVPADSVRQLQTEEPFVLVVREGAAERANIRTGLQIQGRVQVTGGLAAGDRVVLSRDVQPGARVRERR
jgi:HlyD family secretion protein